LAWCDPCYKVQSHKGPIREPGVWYFNSATNEEGQVEVPLQPKWPILQGILNSLQDPKSALIVEQTGEIGLDIFVRLDRLLEIEYADRNQNYFARGLVDHEDAGEALNAVIEKRNFEATMVTRGVDLEVFQDEDPV
jgi:hypothetical protein